MHVCFVNQDMSGNLEYKWDVGSGQNLKTCKLYP